MAKSSHAFMLGMGKNKNNRHISKIMLLIAVMGLTLVCTGCGKSKDNTSDEVSDNSQEVTMSADTAIVTPPDGMETTTNQDIINLITLYYNALKDGDSATVSSVKKDVSEEEKIRLETRAADIEAYDNILIFDEPGANAGEYIVLIYSETKFVGIDTKAPGLQATYVRTDENGNLYIDSNVDEATLTYVQGVVSGEKIANYYSLVQAAFSDAIASDAALNSYMESIDAKLDEAVAAKQAEAAANAAAEEATETASTATVNETVTTTDKVNVRVSDSENADRLGQVEAGTTLTRLEVKENGWSKVDYNGQEGYIKSDFLQSSAPAETTDAAVDNTETEATTDTTAQETTETTTSTASGKVTPKESVRVRASASEDGEYLGTIYLGETYTLYENANGWCKIDYNGKTGYVKSDFVDIQ
ncbi:MAG: SH3 domain-containing protein [Lachnospiraceae bacterium]|nr:SH3 domain-containing protein [Lachnospiraceae bacterium]